MNKLNQEEFLKRSIDKHGYKYDYSKSVYSNQYNSVIITCPIHGEFKQLAKNHMNGFGCNKCGEKRASEKQISSLEDYLLKAKNIHGDTYLYGNSAYNGASEFITITCRVHGDFNQLASAHIAGHGCKKCSNEALSKRLTKTQHEYLEQVYLVHGCKYEYDDVVYTCGEDIISIKCKKHGTFDQKAANHLSGQGCPQCGNDRVADSRRRTMDDFLSKSNLVHNNKYDYSLVKTVNSRDLVEIICPIHGSFMQTPMNHLKGQGCPRCASENSSYIRSQWVRKSRDRVGTFYIIRCYNDNESFYKYGITFTGLSSRYKHGYYMPYKYEIIRLVISNDKEYIWNLEKKFGRFKQKDRYSPIIPFQGSKYECFASYTKIDRTR